MSNFTVGIHIGHDRSVSVVKDGVLIGHIAEERLDRFKHSPSVELPKQGMNQLLSYLDVEIKDIDAIGITYSFVEIDKVVEALADEIRESFDIRDIPVIGVSHHLSHAISAYKTSPFTDALVFVADGAGDLIMADKLESESAYMGSNGKLEKVWERFQDIPASYSDRRTFFNYPYIPTPDHHKQISIARKYEQFTYLLGFKWGQCGKTMGLAPYGKTIISSPDRAYDPTKGFDLRVADLLEELERKRISYGTSFNSFISKNREDIACSIQTCTEQIITSLLQHLHGKFQCENLCLAGGLFLNCVMNHKIIENTHFKNVHIIPASGDDGQSIGAAFAAYEHCFGRVEKNNFSPYLGISYSKNEIVKTLDSFKLKYQELTECELVTAMVEKLEAGSVGGLFRGRSEMGPRALGHRSIIASPKSKLLRNHLNKYVKHREVFRPFSPIIKWEAQFKYFELLHSSPHMLFAAKTRDEYLESIPAVIHCDSSARIQAVKEDDEPFLHQLLNRMEEMTGHPVLLNTSFNTAGEPIVESPKDAVSTFLTSNIDFLVLENFLIDAKY